MTRAAVAGGVEGDLKTLLVFVVEGEAKSFLGHWLQSHWRTGVKF